jgi:hypothetical protein
MADDNRTLLQVGEPARRDVTRSRPLIPLPSHPPTGPARHYRGGPPPHGCDRHLERGDAAHPNSCAAGARVHAQHGALHSAK